MNITLTLAATEEAHVKERNELAGYIVDGLTGEALEEYRAYRRSYTRKSIERRAGCETPEQFVIFRHCEREGYDLPDVYFSLAEAQEHRAQHAAAMAALDAEIAAEQRQSERAEDMVKAALAETAPAPSMDVLRAAYRRDYGATCPYCGHDAGFHDETDPLSDFGCGNCGAFVGYARGVADGPWNWRRPYPVLALKEPSKIATLEPCLCGSVTCSPDDCVCRGASFPLDQPAERFAPMIGKRYRCEVPSGQVDPIERYFVSRQQARCPLCGSGSLYKTGAIAVPVACEETWFQSAACCSCSAMLFFDLNDGDTVTDSTYGQYDPEEYEEPAAVAGMEEYAPSWYSPREGVRWDIGDVTGSGTDAFRDLLTLLMDSYGAATFLTAAVDASRALAERYRDIESRYDEFASVADDLESVSTLYPSR